MKMKKLLLAMGLVATLAACSDDSNVVYDYPARPDVEPMPAVTITPGTAGHNTLEFTITPANAEECSFYCIETQEDDKQLSAGDVISLGKAVDALAEGTYKAENLFDETSYNVYAAVRKGNKSSLTVTKMTTTKAPEIPVPTPETNPMYIWVDAAANFPDFANDKEKIRRDLTLAKETGFTDVVVDVRPTNGDVLFQTSHCDQVAWLGAWASGGYMKFERTADWDYLGAFIEIGHELGLRIHAGFNTMAGGNESSLGAQGILVRDSSKKEWATVLNTKNGFVNTLDSEETTFFFNPHNEEVQEYICNLLKDLAAYEDLDGIILDRGRFDSFQSDFSELTKELFEEYVGETVDFNKDVLPAGFTGSIDADMPYEHKHLKKWLEFRVKAIHDLMHKAKDAVRSVNPTVKFGVYVGGWYSSYYDCGVNWASPEYNVAADFPRWATADYKNYGYADLMDHMLIGAYASPGSVYGTSEWTMQGFCQLAMQRILGACPLVCGGPDVGNWDSSDKYTDAEEYEAITNSVKACYDACDGYFLFDMIHLKKGDLWQYAKAGIDEVKAEL